MAKDEQIRNMERQLEALRLTNDELTQELKFADANKIMMEAKVTAMRMLLDDKYKTKF